jgi:putative membrane protein
MKRIYLFFRLVLFASFSVQAQDRSNDTTARYFIIQASIGNLQEIQIARLALERSTNNDVKAFANRMIADHSNVQAQLMQMVRSRNFQIPPQATETPVEDMMLKNLPAKDFDRIYVHMMVPDHRQAVHLFEVYALTGKDPDVSFFAKQNLPILKEHLASIVAIDNSMNGATAGLQYLRTSLRSPYKPGYILPNFELLSMFKTSFLPDSFLYRRSTSM